MLNQPAGQQAARAELVGVFVADPIQAAGCFRFTAQIDQWEGEPPEGSRAYEGLGEWRWDRATAPFRSPGTRDLALVAKSDGYATGLIAYTLRQAGLPAEQPIVKKALQWLRANQLPVRAGNREWPAWRAHSLNYDREHGGSRGEPWRRLFMSDAATALASLALSTSD